MQIFPTATSPQSLPATITDALMLVLDVTEGMTAGTTAMNRIAVSNIDTLQTLQFVTGNKHALIHFSMMQIRKKIETKDSLFQQYLLSLLL